MNSAARLYRIYDKLSAQSTNQQMVQTWCDVFDLDKDNPHCEDDVTACVMALRAEIALARQRLHALDVPPNLTQPGFDRLRNVASPGHLHSHWHSHKGNIEAADCRKVFEWAVWALRDDGELDMSDEDMKELEAELDSLEAALRETEVPTYLSEFIQQQVETIRAALRIYGVQGAKPLQGALQKVAGAYKTQEKPLAKAFEAAPEEAKGLFARTGRVIKKTAEVCDNLDKIGKLGEQAWTLVGTVAPLLVPYASKLLSAN